MGLFSRNKDVATSTPTEEIFQPMPIKRTHDGTGKAAMDLQAFKAVAPELEGKYDSAKISLEKKRATGMRAAVYLVVDRSGSMTGYFGNGSVQDLAERVLAAAAHFDDDGIVPLVFFGYNAHPVQPITLSHYRGRVQELHRELGSMGSTNYGAAMRAVIEHYRQSGADVPALVFFQTDGAPDSQAEAEKIIRGAAGLPIFWQFIGFGRDQFVFLKNLDEMSGRVVDNAGFFEAGADPKQLSDADLYDKMLGEYPQWVQAARREGIVA